MIVRIKIKTNTFYAWFLFYANKYNIFICIISLQVHIVQRLFSNNQIILKYFDDSKMNVVS